jgi:ketosteroid isomerase-like protein
MSQENVEIVRRIFEAFPQTQDALRRGDFPIGPPISQDIEWDASEIRLPDIGDGVLRGHEGVRRFWMAWLTAWDKVTVEYELHDAGDKVVAVIDQSNQGSEIAIPLQTAQVWTFSDGEVIHWKLYMDHDAALKAVGLSE